MLTGIEDRLPDGKMGGVDHLRPVFQGCDTGGNPFVAVELAAIGAAAKQENPVQSASLANFGQHIVKCCVHSGRAEIQKAVHDADHQTVDPHRSGRVCMPG